MNGNETISRKGYDEKIQIENPWNTIDREQPIRTREGIQQISAFV